MLAALRSCDRGGATGLHAQSALVRRETCKNTPRGGLAGRELAREKPRNVTVALLRAASCSQCGALGERDLCA